MVILGHRKKNCLFGVILGRIIHWKYDIDPSPKPTRISWDESFGPQKFKVKPEDDAFV